MKQVNENSNATKLLNLGMNMLTHPLQELMDAATKSVSIQVDSDTVKELKHNKYKMCFAKKVGNEDYNVVWHSYTAFLEKNSFAWTPVYSVFGSNKFVESMEVEVSCRPVKIKLGETTTLDQDGILSKAISGGSDTALTMKNNYGAIHPGVNQLSIGLDGKEESTPIYVAAHSALIGEVELRPVEKVMIWFEQNIVTGTMFSTARSRAIEVDLTFGNSVQLRYDGEWKII